MKPVDLRRGAGPALVAGLALLALAPVLLSRGYILIGDMSFVPSQPWKPAWLGIDGSVPRAVPADAVVSVLSWVVPGDLLQKAALLGALLLAGLGMHRLVRFVLPDRTWVAPLGAGVLYLWNPWVLERLAIGHWGLLLGYAALPWIVQGALRFRRDPGWSRLAGVVVPVVLASWGSPTGGILAGLVVLVVVADRFALRPGLAAMGAVVAVNLPWLLPGLLGNAATTDVSGVEVFAARSDSALGTGGSVLTFGGIWKGSIVPGERDSMLLVGLALVISLAGLFMLGWSARRRSTDRLAGRLLFLAALGLGLALLPTFDAGYELSTWLVAHVPGAGILRDSQKWLALLALGVGVGFGLALDAGHSAVRGSDLPGRWALVLVALFPVVLLPSLAWGIAGKLDPVDYPAEWSQVRGILQDRPASSLSLVALPFSAYQAFAWNDGRAALDPALRFFPGEVVTNDALVVGDDVVAGEDPVAAEIALAIAAGEPLGPVLLANDVRYVVIERTAAGAATVNMADVIASGTLLFDGVELALVDLGRGSSSSNESSAWWVIGGDLLALGVALAAGTSTLRQIGGKKDKTG